MTAATAVSTRGLPWIGTSVVTDGFESAADCMKAAGLDFDVRLAPMYVQSPDSLIEVKDRFAVVSDGDWSASSRIFGTVGSGYRIVQYREAFDFFDHIIGEGQAVYEAAGHLRNKRQAFIAARIPQAFTAGGDEHEQHLLLRTSHDGTRAVSVAVVVMRMRCTNAVTAAFRGAKAKWSVAHRANVDARLVEARETLGLTEVYAKAYGEFADTLVTKKMPDKKFEDLLKESLPDRASSVKLRNGILELRAGTNTISSDHRGTAWGAYNAVTEYMDWERATRTASGRMVSVIDGVNARLRNRVAQELVAA